MTAFSASSIYRDLAHPLHVRTCKMLVIRPLSQPKTATTTCYMIPGATSTCAGYHRLGQAKTPEVSSTEVRPYMAIAAVEQRQTNMVYYLGYTERYSKLTELCKKSR